jgi:hypothetical protein
MMMAVSGHSAHAGGQAQAKFKRLWTPQYIVGHWVIQVRAPGAGRSRGDCGAWIRARGE